MKALIDSYNLMLPYGTGIKAYATSHLKALKALNISPYVLTDLDELRAGKKECYIESPARPSRIALAISIIKLLTCKGRRPKSIRAEEITNQTPEGWINYVDHFLNAPRIYDSSMAYFRLTGRPVLLKNKPNVDIFHRTYHAIPIQLKNAVNIVTIHDLVPLVLPDTTLTNPTVFHRLTFCSLEKSDAVVVPSNATKEDLLRIFGRRYERKIYVIHEYVHDEVSHIDPVWEASVLKSYELSSKAYILYVGNIEPRKNLSRLLQAYALSGARLPLVIAGRKAWLWEDDLKQLEVGVLAEAKKNIRFLSFVPKAVLKVLYKNAYVFVFPSLYEGFGLPPLEAMHYGVPVIASNASSLPEVCGEAALYVDPFDIEDIASKIRVLVTDRSLATELGMRGKERSKVFSLDRYANAIQELYKGLR